jgi:hypothetical protein
MPAARDAINIPLLSRCRLPVDSRIMYPLCGPPQLAVEPLVMCYPTSATTSARARSILGRCRRSPPGCRSAGRINARRSRCGKDATSCNHVSSFHRERGHHNSPRLGRHDGLGRMSLYAERISRHTAVDNRSRVNASSSINGELFPDSPHFHGNGERSKDCTCRISSEA